MNADTPVAFTVGLLHDIGKLVLSQALTADLQAEIRKHIEHDKLSRAEAEKAVLGTDHGEVGALLLQGWHLPEDVVEAVANHHQPILKPRPRLSVVTHLANCLAHLSGSAPGWDGYAVRISNDVVTCLEITPEQLEQMVVNVRDLFARVEQFMNLA